MNVGIIHNNKSFIQPFNNNNLFSTLIPFLDEVEAEANPKCISKKFIQGASQS